MRRGLLWERRPQQHPAPQPSESPFPLLLLGNPFLDGSSLARRVSWLPTNLSVVRDRAVGECRERVGIKVGVP